MQMLNSILGFCVGDALGVPVEFESRETLKKCPVVDMMGGGTHGQAPGTWSDDTSQILCVIDSLCNGYNIKDVESKLIAWLFEGLWTARGQVFDVGNSTRKALYERSSGRYFESSEEDNGNGSLMRTLPLSFFLSKENSLLERIKIIEEVSSITHNHPLSIIGCILYNEFAMELLNEGNKIKAYRHMQEVGDLLGSDPAYKPWYRYYGLLIYRDIWLIEEEFINSTGYIVDALEACIWSLFQAEDFTGTVLKAINLGGDTDTIGALTGGLAGVLYNVPRNWVDSIARKQDIIKLVQQFQKTL